MDTTRRSKRRLWSQPKGKFDTEPTGYGDDQSACGSFKAQCTAEMKPITDEESDGLSIAKRDASPQDQRHSCLGARPKEKIDANKDINYADKGLEEEEDEEKIQVLLEVIFNIRTENEIKDTVEFQCDVREYMIWKYMMNSPTQCKKCSKQLSFDNENIALTTNSAVTILSPVNNREHAARIAKKVFDYAIRILGPLLTCTIFKFKEKDIDKGTAQLNKRFGEEIAFAATVNKCIYIVFPTIHRKRVDLLLQEANDIEEGLIEETVRLKRVLFKFPKVIEVCKRNANIVQENDQQENRVVCTVSGRKNDVLNAISELENMEKHLKMKYLSFSPRISNGLKHLFVEDIVNERLMEENPFCVLEQTDNYLRLYSFNETELSKASDFVSHLIVESSEKMIGNCTNTLQHLKKHFKKWLLVDWDSRNCKLYMIGLSDAVEAARAQIVDIQEGRVIVGKASELELQVTEVYNVRNTLHFRYFESSVFTNNIADKFKVKVAFCQKNYSIKVTGVERDVKSALETFLKIEKEIVSKDTIFCEKKAVQYFATETSSTFLKETENCNDVLIEKHKLKVFGDKNFQVLKDTYKSYVTWSTSKKRYIYLEQMSLEKVSALVKIKPVASDILEGNIIKGGYIVEMGIPVWKNGRHSENEDLDKALSNVFNNISQTKEETVAFSLSPVAHWGFSEFMKSVVKHSVKWLLASQCHKAHTVKLCVEDEQCFSVTDAYMDQCVDYLIRGTRLTRELETTVCKGQLDKIKADVLVNTAAPTLDLTKGYVSAALAKRAGPKLQKECKKSYPNGITVDDVAETNGYQADCTKIFHVTLLPYSVKDASACEKRFRNVMMHCLKMATSYGYASIAFPAMGSGSLRYPVEVVASEMFGTVEKFKEECPNTTLQRVMFVIYEKDEEVLEYFNQIEKDTSQQKAMLRGRPAVKVKITGTEENVHHAKSHIEEELAESNESVTKCFSNVSSAEFQAVENLYSMQMTSFRDRGVDMRHVEMHDEILLTGVEDLLDDAYKTVGGYLDRINKMQRCEVPVTNMSSTTVQEAILDMRYSRRGICYTFDKNFSTVTILADSEKLVHEAEEEIKKKLGFGCSVSGSTRFEEKMDTSDTEVLDNVASITAKPLVQRTFSWSKDSKHLRVYQQKDIVVKVYEANILEVPVDAIVNAANEDLQHCGGVAYAIAKAAGVELIRESEALMRQNKRSLDVTSVVSTTAGSLDYKCILHAVGPRWSSYQPITKSSLKQCGKDLKETIVNCLLLAQEKGLTTIALPTISSGIFKVPKDLCATQYAKAVLGFKGRHVLKEIHFVDVAPSMIDILRKTFDAMITKKQKSPFDVNVYVDQKSKKTSQPAIDENDKFYTIDEREYNHFEREPKQKNTSIDTSFISDGNILKCSFGTNPQVEIYVGDIVNLSGIQAIACSEDKYAQSKGVIAQLLLKKGGDEYRREKQSRFANIRNYEEVIITSAGANTFDWIIHAIVPHKDAVIIAYRNILKAANEREFTSLALPLLGTGFRGIDEVTSTEELFDELLQFYQNNRSSLLKVHIVLKDKEVASVVQDVFKGRIKDIKQERTLEEKETTCDDINTKTKIRERENEEEKEKMSVDMKTRTILRENGKTAKDVDNSTTEESCVICMDKVTDGVKLKCGHIFCRECIDGYFKVKKVCPTCGQVCGVITGDQPNGSMNIVKRQIRLSGFDRHNSISITYNFVGGRQGPEHPRPGTPYKGITRTAYVPDNKEGREVCAMLKVAFERRLVFTIGTSRTTGQEGVITWNDIHHKTDSRPNTQFGYPDDTYLQRVREEMEVKGVTLKDMDKKFLKRLEKEIFEERINADE